MNIAIIENNKVTNVVTGEPEIVAELFDETQIVTEATGQAWIGARFNGEKFEPVKPFDSWIWNEENFKYDPPKPKPEGRYYWDEKTGEWVENVAPFPSWIWIEEGQGYEAPKPYPEDGKKYQWNEESGDWVEFDPEAEA